MSFLVAMSYNRFKQFLRDSKSFFYTEDAYYWYVFKNTNEMIAHSVVAKRGDDNDTLFRENEFTSTGAIFVPFVVIDGKRFPELVEVTENKVVDDAD